MNKIRTTLEEKGIREIKEDLNIQNRYNIVFIGRLLENKKPEMLLEIFERLKDNYDIGIHIIGDGEMKKLIEQKISSKKYQNIYCHGGIHDDEIIGRFLYVADLMVMPGSLGLAINHAFCFDTPVVSLAQSNKGLSHGPEIELLISNETGYLAKNLDDMTNFIKYYLGNQKIRTEFVEKIRFCIMNQCSVDYMLKGFVDCINYVKSER